MAPFLQHILQQPFHLAPVVVRALEHQVGIRGQLRITLGIDQGAAGRTAIDFPGRVGDEQCATGLCGDRKLTRQSEIEGIDRLNSQPSGVIGQIPASQPRVAQSRLRECQETRPVRTLCVDFASQGPHDARAHLRGCLAGEGDRKDFFRLVDFSEQAQQSLRQHGGLARSGRCL